ncbi:hypothetical protein BKA70DRAFT_1229243 [Coprinopsis sp. MPI-PUGE-AT-0042]|nr:hypothetical protein BKA70DRAFT_1229243 [Coprinopsis sp. MPI-PUGE-AT-0042]
MYPTRRVASLPSVYLQSLKYLSFSATPHFRNWDFLGKFRAPLLSDLVLAFDADDAYTDDVESLCSSIQPFLESCHLDSFSLTGRLFPQVFQRILALVPDSIRTLDLLYWPYGVFGTSSLDQLPDASEANFFPKLELLRIAEVPCNDFAELHATRSVTSLVSFLSQRMEQTRSRFKLKSLEVTRGVDDAWCFPDEELEELEERGLNVIIWSVVVPPGPFQPTAFLL